MSNNSEFEHGTEHKFSVTKNSGGSYSSCCAHGVEGPFYDKGTKGKIWYSKQPEGYYYSNLKSAKEHMKRIHDGEEQ
jgi:hypothetical protein